MKMTINGIIVFVLFFVLISCNEKNELVFEGLEIDFPINVKDLNNKIPLAYFPYEGIKGTWKNYSIDIQLQNESNNYWDCDHCDLNSFSNKTIKSVIFKNNQESFNSIKSKITGIFNNYNDKNINFDYKIIPKCKMIVIVFKRKSVIYTVYFYDTKLIDIPRFIELIR